MLITLSNFIPKVLTTLSKSHAEETAKKEHAFTIGKHALLHRDRRNRQSWTSRTELPSHRLLLPMLTPPELKWRSHALPEPLGVDDQ